MNKNKKIELINKIITDHGNFTIADVDAEESPCIFHKYGVIVLAETFYKNMAEAVTYIHDNDEHYEIVPFTEMDNDVIDEIYELALIWEKIKKEG